MHLRDILQKFSFPITPLYKANESQFPVSCYIIFHDCVGDHFIIHYSLFYTISLLHLLQVYTNTYLCIHVINHCSWCSLQTLQIKEYKML